MKRMTVLSVLVGSVIVAGTIRAETISIRVTREKIDDPLTIKAGDKFTIKVERVIQKDKGDFLDFHVTVKQRMPVVDVSVPGVEMTSRGGARTFSFRVAAKDVEKATFTYDEDLTTGGGRYYWFHLKDFVPSK